MDKSKDAILVTGATGQQGGALARELLKSGYMVSAMTRHPEGEAARALARQGATIVAGNLDDADSLRRAMNGKWGVYAVQNTWEAGVEGEEAQGHRQARLAREAGVHHYVYSSVASAHRRTGIPHFDNKARIEETVRGLGFPSWTIIRPAFFMENLLGPWFKPAIDNGQLAMGIMPGTKLQMIAVADIGAYLKLAFEKHAEFNQTALDIAGDELAMPQVARVLGEVTGHPVVHVQVPIAEVRKASEDYAIMLEWFDRVGYDVDIAANAKKYGVKPTGFTAWARSVRWT